MPDGPRLAYADRLDERGDPRGEFIRLQVALAHGNAPAGAAIRAKELEAAHRGEWLRPFDRLVYHAEFSRERS